MYKILLNNCIVVLLLFVFLYANNSHALELNILCWEGYVNEKHITEFSKIIEGKYKVDIHLNVINVTDPGQFYNMVLFKKADLISPAHNIPKSEQWPLIPNGLVIPIDIENIPNYKNIISPLQKAHHISVFDDIYGVPIVYGLYGLYYNVDKVSKIPDSWTVFWEPQYKNKYSVSINYMEANAYISGLSMGFSKDNISQFGVADILRIKKRLWELMNNANNFWQGVDKADNLKGMSIATGWGFAISELNKAGEQWKVAYPKEGTTGWIDNWMIGYSLQDKPLLKRIAEEWINYSLSPEVQAAYATELSQFPVNMKAGQYLTEQQIKSFHLNQPDFIKKEIIIWPELVSKEQKLIRSVWPR